jgi:hypothetical protein
MVYFICTIIEILNEEWYVSVPMKKIAEAKEKFDNYLGTYTLLVRFNRTTGEYKVVQYEAELDNNLKMCKSAYVRDTLDGNNDDLLASMYKRIADSF